VHVDGRLVGVVDRQDRTVHMYVRGDDHGGTRPPVVVRSLDDPETVERLGGPTCDGLREELELLDVAGEGADMDAVLAGEATPVYFGSALTNFGVDVFLDRFLALAPPPPVRESNRGPIEPASEEFSGFVFKVQANMDPRHRDRVAFVRVCSGRFEPGMEAVVSRTGRTLRLARPQTFMAQERQLDDDAVAGDIVGVHDRDDLRVGDTISVSGIEYPGVPRFSPEHFAVVRLREAMRRKHLDRGLRHLAEEGTILLLFSEVGGGPVPIVGAVGRLQFEVLVDRLSREYGVEVSLESLSFQCARWATGSDADIARVAGAYGRRSARDAEGHPMILFESEWALRRTEEEEKSLRLHDVQPPRGSGSRTRSA